MTITFKKEAKLTGLAAIAHPYQSVDIKVNKKVVGYIAAPNAFTDDLWIVMFRVWKTDNDKKENCSWKWVTLKQKFDTEEEARIFIKENEEKILKLNLYYED